MRKPVNFLSILVSLFLISSCHYVSKKSDCCDVKRSGGQYHKEHKHSKCKKSKDKKTCAKCAKKSANKDCCGKARAAGLALIKDLQKGKIKGSVFFEKADRYEVKVTADIKGLSPNKKFGFHVHEFGTCDNKGLLAGGHLNPWGEKHAGPKDKKRHLGDLGNLESNKMGSAFYSASVEGHLKKFMGRSVIIHAKADDMKSQPTGNAGERIACGVIVASMPPVREGTTEKKATDKKASSNKKAKAPVEKAISSEKKEVDVKKAVSGGKADHPKNQ